MIRITDIQCDGYITNGKCELNLRYCCLMDDHHVMFSEACIRLPAELDDVADAAAVKQFCEANADFIAECIKKDMILRIETYQDELRIGVNAQNLQFG